MERQIRAGESPRVLVAEYDRWRRSLLAELLEARGYAVVQASSGQIALWIASSVELSLILLDLALPDLPRVDLLELLTRGRPTRDVAVLVFSAHAGLMQDNDVLHRADGIVQNPFDLADLSANVERLVSKPPGVWRGSHGGDKPTRQPAA